MTKIERKPLNQQRGTDRQTRNRHSSAGITQREASQIMSMINKLDKIKRKKNLFTGYYDLILDAELTLTDLLERSRRL